MAVGCLYDISILYLPGKKRVASRLFFYFPGWLPMCLEGTRMIDEDKLYDELKPICEGMGLSLVDCRFQQTKTSYACQLIIWTPAGVSTAECAKLFRIVQPRLEILTNSQDINLEVSSPGTDRKIRLPREYQIFMGKGFTAVMRDGQTHGGVLESADSQYIVLKTPKGVQKLPLADIAKSKLDYTQEVR
jgi:ribosome maturation factor RimP